MQGSHGKAPVASRLVFHRIEGADEKETGYDRGGGRVTGGNGESRILNLLTERGTDPHIHIHWHMDSQAHRHTGTLIDRLADNETELSTFLKSRME